MAPKTQIVHTALDEATERQLKDVARRYDMPVSAVIRKAIQYYLAVTAKEKP